MVNWMPCSRQDVERFQIDRGFGKPHAFRIASEAMAEIFDAPDHLGQLVARIGERHDHVVVALRHRRTMAGEALRADAVGFQDFPVGFGCFVLHPGQQGGAEVEADAGVVVDDFRDAAFRRPECARRCWARSIPR